MQKRQTRNDNYLYSKSKEHPAIRFSLYWDIDQRLLFYAFADIFGDGRPVGYVLERLNVCLEPLEKIINQDKFDGFVMACNKYYFWRQARLSPDKKVQQITQELKSKLHNRLPANEPEVDD